MIKNWAIKLSIPFFVLFVVSGCASLPLPEEMKAQVATYQLPKFPEDGEAIVYIVRPSSSYKVSMLNVFLDNQDTKSEMGSTLGRQYIYFSLTPGEHKLLSKGENWAETNVFAKAGDVIFIQQEPAMPILRGARNKLLKLNDYEGKYHVKTLTMGTTINRNQPNVQTREVQARIGQNAKANTYTGSVTAGRFAKGIGFSNMNYKLEVTADNGDKTTFYIRSDSRVIDVNGNQIDWKTLSGFKGRKVEIEYFTITDATGGDPSRNDFAYEIGQKGVRLLRFLD
ncbi:MAG TPA: hypothetical protein PLP18_07255 [Smithellaceae bacterium]|nr:hypothetical protein [Smithellaceae bacterium]